MASRRPTPRAGSATSGTACAALLPCAGDGVLVSASDAESGDAGVRPGPAGGPAQRECPRQARASSSPGDGSRRLAHPTKIQPADLALVGRATALQAVVVRVRTWGRHHLKTGLRTLGGRVPCSPFPAGQCTTSCTSAPFVALRERCHRPRVRGFPCSHQQVRAHTLIAFPANRAPAASAGACVHGLPLSSLGPAD